MDEPLVDSLGREIKRKPKQSEGFLAGVKGKSKGSFSHVRVPDFEIGAVMARSWPLQRERKMAYLESP